MFLTASVSILTFNFMIQKQALDEMWLFKDLFKEFNARYDKLNAKLYRILRKKGKLANKDKDVLYDYFNLCSEEAFMYKQGYIYPEVWKSWRNGMNIFFSNERIRSLWEQEKKTNSYYGLEKVLE